MKEFFLYTLIFAPFIILHEILEIYLDKPWLAFLIVASLIIAARAGLYFYRKSKGIKDTWPDD